MFDGETDAPHGGITGTVCRLLESLVGFLTTKVELISAEIQEEKRRIFELLILAAAAMLFSAMALVVLTFSIVAYFWEDEGMRMGVLLFLCGLYVLIAAFFFVRLQRKASLRVKVFETTVEELKNDSEWIKHHL